MHYHLTDNSRVDFIAHAPLHTFRGQATTGLRGTAEFDLERRIVRRIAMTADTGRFDTGDQEKNRAMAEFFTFAKHPETSFFMTECREFSLLANSTHRVTVQGVLDFAGIRRQLPITSIVQQKKQSVLWELQFKWSFAAYGLKPPSLFFLKLRDIVDIRARLDFIPTLAVREEQ